ncbi:MAG: hypothetical protein IRZ02_04830 [Acidothermus sp.]|nr:hypothetical protein [Acidothermus sp.]
MRGLCALVLASFALASLAGCSGHRGSTQPTSGVTPSPKIAVEANANRLSVEINKNEIVRVTVPPLYENDGQVTQYEVDPPGTAVVAPVPGAPPGYFRGTGPGTVTIRARQVPPCATQSPSPPSSCDTRPADIGLVTVTVKG